MSQCVGLLIRNGNGQILLQMRDNRSGIADPLKWDFFGGGVEEGESIEQAAVREMREELGIEAQPEEFTLVDQFPRAGTDEHLVAFVRPLEWGKFRVFEGAGAGFFSREDLPLLPLSGAAAMFVAREHLR